MEQLLASWEGESVTTHRDRKTGAWMFVCVHSTRLGPSGGGTRMKSYPSPVDALADGLRLSEAMTLKFASVALPMGGGKAVIALPDSRLPAGDERRRLLYEFGTFVRPGHEHVSRRHGRDRRGLPVCVLQVGGCRRIG
jgi:leucine dehydrogenase